MKRAVFLALAGMVVAGDPEPYGVIWARKAESAIVQAQEDVMRVKRGEFHSQDASLIKMLAAYGHYKAVVEPQMPRAPAPPAHSCDSLDTALWSFTAEERSALISLRGSSVHLSRMASSGKASPADTNLVKAMAAYLLMRMELVTSSSELGR